MWYVNRNKLCSMGEVNSILPHSHHMNLSWSWRREDEHFSCEALNVELVKILRRFKAWCVKVETWSLKNARGDNFKIPFRLDKSCSDLFHVVCCLPRHTGHLPFPDCFLSRILPSPSSHPLAPTTPGCHPWRYKYKEELAPIWFRLGRAASESFLFKFVRGSNADSLTGTAISCRTTLD